MLDDKTINVIVATLNSSVYSSFSPTLKEKVKLATTIIEAGWVEKILNNDMIKNIINLLAPFIRNQKIKNAIKLLQDGLEEEIKIEKKKDYDKAIGKPRKKNFRGSEDISNLEIYENKTEYRIEIFKVQEGLWRVVDYGNGYIDFKNEEQARAHMSDLFDKYAEKYGSEFKLGGITNGTNK